MIDASGKEFAPGSWVAVSDSNRLTFGWVESIGRGSAVTIVAAPAAPLVYRSAGVWTLHGGQILVVDKGRIPAAAVTMIDAKRRERA